MKFALLANLLGPARRRIELVPATAYTRPYNAPLLSQLFALLAQENETGRIYRSKVEEWLYSRRVVRTKYEGISFKLEVDDPTVGKWWNLMPIGGRIQSTNGSTWIELTHKQAHELNEKLRWVTQNILEGWLKERKLVGEIRDDFGVKTKSPHREINTDKIPDDNAFYEREAQIAQQADDESDMTNRAEDDDASVYYYKGFHSYPSKCRIFHYEEDGRVHFALSHIEYGGTSPTNMFEDLATRLRMDFYPNTRPADISWYDHWPRHHSLTSREELTRVHLEWDPKGGRYDDPNWRRGVAPERLQRLIWQTIPPSEQGNKDNFLHWSMLLTDAIEKLKAANSQPDGKRPMDKDRYFRLLDLLERQYTNSKPSLLNEIPTFEVIGLPGEEREGKHTYQQGVQQARLYAESNAVYPRDGMSVVSMIQAMLFYPFEDIKATFIPSAPVLDEIAMGDIF